MRHYGWPSGVATLAIALTLAGCGGGSGGGGGSDGPVSIKGGSSGAGGSTFACPAPPSFPADPLFAQQWYIRNTGQRAYSSFGGNADEDIHLCGPATPRGAGVTVAVVDTGAEKNHEDLGNLETGAVATTSHNFMTGTADPTNIAVDGDHGTSVSGIITAPDNGIGINGIAAAAKLVVYNLLGDGFFATNTDEANSLGGAAYSAGAAIFNQSWGYDIAEPLTIAVLNEDAEANYLSGVTTLRGGLGAIYVKAAGNGFGQDYPTGPPYFGLPCPNAKLTCQNANMDPYHVLPYQIVVGATNAKGVKSSYSTAGSALWISAPGGEYGASPAYVGGGYPAVVYQPAIVTTDQSGCILGYSASSFGINAFDDGTDAANSDCNYTSAFNGTSSASPVTSGVVALLLGVNPALTWRDVKHILAATADRVDAGFTAIEVSLDDGFYPAEPAWVTNGAGYHFHNWYGFGRVHAYAALAMAAGFTPNGFGGATPFGPLVDSTYLPGGVDGSGAIPDNSSAGATGSVTLSSATLGIDFIEAVQIQVNIVHPFPGDVGIELTSPSGTRSVLLNIRNAFGGNVEDFIDWVALSNAFYGENPGGTWTLKVVDGFPQDSGTLTSWNIRIFGHSEE